MAWTSAIALLWAASLIDASLEAPSPPEDAHYRWLKTSELERLLRGSWIVEADNRPRYMKTPEHFQQEGHYVRHADNFEAHGSYTFRDGQVCDRAEQDAEVCRRVLIDKDGQYWIIGRYNRRFLTHISVKPLR